MTIYNAVILNKKEYTPIKVREDETVKHGPTEYVVVDGETYFSQNDLVVFIGEIFTEEELQAKYDDWRDMLEDLINDEDLGVGGTTDCGESIAREDFIESIGLEYIGLEAMLELERDYDGRH